MSNKTHWWNLFYKGYDCEDILGELLQLEGMQLVKHITDSEDLMSSLSKEDGEPCVVCNGEIIEYDYDQRSNIYNFTGFNEDSGINTAFEYWFKLDDKQSKKLERMIVANRVPDEKIEKSGGASRTNLTLFEAADFLRVSEHTLRRLAKANRIPFNKVGRRYIFTQHDLNNYLRDSRMVPGAKRTMNCATAKPAKVNHDRISRNLGLGGKRGGKD